MVENYQVQGTSYWWILYRNRDQIAVFRIDHPDRAGLVSSPKTDIFMFSIYLTTTHKK